MSLYSSINCFSFLAFLKGMFFRSSYYCNLIPKSVWSYGWGISIRSSKDELLKNLVSFTLGMGAKLWRITYPFFSRLVIKSMIPSGVTVKVACELLGLVNLKSDFDENCRTLFYVYIIWFSFQFLSPLFYKYNRWGWCPADIWIWDYFYGL